MSTRRASLPGSGHPIVIERNPKRVIVTFGGEVIAETVTALTLREASYPPVQYIPREDVDLTAIERSNTASYCPYKGDASYFSIRTAASRSVDAIWSYEAPHEAVADIKGRMAFYPDRVDAIDEVEA